MLLLVLGYTYNIFMGETAQKWNDWKAGWGPGAADALVSFTHVYHMYNYSQYRTVFDLLLVLLLRVTVTVLVLLTT